MTDPDIILSLNDTLELDTIIEKDYKGLNPINNIDNSFEVGGFSTYTGVLKPSEPCQYTIKVNGQEILIKVQDPNKIPVSGVSRWLGDGSSDTISDEWSNNNGTINGPTQNSTTPLNPGYALEFSESTSDDVNIGNISEFNFDESDFTITVWVRSSNGTGTGGFGDVILSEVNEFTDSGGITFYVDDSEGLRLGVDNASIDISEGNSFPTENYYLLTLRREGDKQDVKRGSTSSSLSEVMSTTNSVSVGTNYDFTIGENIERIDNNESWNDLIYDMRIYNDSLSDSRLEDIRLGNE